MTWCKDLLEQSDICSLIRCWSHLAVWHLTELSCLLHTTEAHIRVCQILHWIVWYQQCMRLDKLHKDGKRVSGSGSTCQRTQTRDSTQVKKLNAACWDCSTQADHKTTAGSCPSMFSSQTEFGKTHCTNTVSTHVRDYSSRTCFAFKIWPLLTCVSRCSGQTCQFNACLHKITILGECPQKLSTPGE